MARTVQLECVEIGKAHARSFSAIGDETLWRALADEDFSSVTGVTVELRSHLDECADCRSDIDWYLQIRGELDVGNYPCVHVAYACSSKANKIMERHLGTFSITTVREPPEGIVIGFCPWCGIALNVSAAYEGAPGP